MHLTEEQKSAFVKLFEEGALPKQACRIVGVSLKKFNDQLKIDEHFRSIIKIAREAGYDALADDLITITEREPDVMKARLISENTRWYLSKRRAALYGDKVEVNLGMSPDLSAAMSAARSRLGSVRSVSPLPVPEAPGMLNPSAFVATGFEPVAARSAEPEPEPEPVPGPLGTARPTALGGPPRRVDAASRPVPTPAEPERSQGSLAQNTRIPGEYAEGPSRPAVQDSGNECLEFDIHAFLK